MVEVATLRHSYWVVGVFLIYFLHWDCQIQPVQISVGFPPLQECQLVSQ